MTDPEKKPAADFLFPISGLIALVLVIIVLLSTPGMILAREVQLIDTELGRATGSEMYVVTKMDFGSGEHMRAFPREIAGWRSVDFNTSTLPERLNADVLFVRGYIDLSNGLLQRDKMVYLTIIQSENRSSFHPPPICYGALGYKIEEETTEEVLMSNITWAQSPLTSVSEQGEAVLLSVKKLVVFKESTEGTVTDREVTLYFYVKDNPLATDKVTLVRASGHAPINGSIDRTLNLTKFFMAEAFPYMFEVREEEELIAVQLAEFGIAGWLMIGVLISVPVGIMVYPGIKNKIKKRNKGLEEGER